LLHENQLERRKRYAASRNVSFQQVKDAIDAGNFMGPEVNPTRQGQQIIIVWLNNYPHIVPIVIDDSGNWFLKTIIPSRKVKKEGRI